MKVARVRRGPQPRLTSPFGVGGTIPQPALDDLSDVDTTGVSDGDTIVFDDATDTWVPGTGGGGSSLPWFIVTDYGAVGNGSTDDLTAINAAIAAYNAAGGGVLYFPAVASTDYYYVSDGLDALTKPGLVFGDGAGSSSGAASPIATDDTTANLFTVSSDSITFRAMRLVNFSGAETAGAAIGTTTGAGNECRYENLWIEGFRDGMDLLHGGEWSMFQCHITNPVRYGVYITNADLPDGGDWSMVSCWFGTRSRNGTSAIRQESAGGGKVANLKINQNSAADQVTFGGVKRYTTGYDVAISSSTNATSVLTIVGSSFENIDGDAIKIATTSTGTFGLVAISGIEVSIPGNSGSVLNLNASSAGAISLVTLDDVTAVTGGTARAAVSLTNTDRVALGQMVLSGWNARYTSSGDANTIGPALTTTTAFPANPFTNDMCFRSDRALLYYYDGTRWLTVNEYSETLHNLDVNNGFSANTAAAQWGVTDLAANGQWVTRLVSTTYVATTNDGSKFWTVQLTSRSPSATAHNIGSTFSTSADTNDQFVKHTVTIGAAVTSGDTHFALAITKTSTPGTIYPIATVFYRLIG